MGVCKLCRRERDLCESHILPEFVYEPVYEDRAHKYFQISTDSASYPKRRPKGLYEKLLCKPCEDLIGKNETYAREVIYGGTIEIVCSNEAYGIKIQELDYSKIKLFQLSVIWRAGVSGLPEFQAVDLGPKEPELRRMVLDQDPGEPGEYPCFLFFSGKLSQQLGDMLLLPPDRIRLGPQIAYRCYMAGFFWVFFPSARPTNVPAPGFSLSKDGVLIVYRSDKVADVFINQLVQGFKDSGNIDRALRRGRA